MNAGKAKKFLDKPGLLRENHPAVQRPNGRSADQLDGHASSTHQLREEDDRINVWEARPPRDLIEIPVQRLNEGEVQTIRAKSYHSVAASGLYIYAVTRDLSEFYLVTSYGTRAAAKKQFASAFAAWLVALAACSDQASWALSPVTDAETTGAMMRVLAPDSEGPQTALLSDLTDRAIRCMIGADNQSVLLEVRTTSAWLPVALGRVP